MPNEPSNEDEYLKHQILLKDLNPYKFFTYNATCTFVLDAPFYPIDVIRTRLQVQGSSFVQNNSFPKYSNTWDAAKKLIKYEGAKGLFQGFLTCEFGYATSHVIYYGAYEATKQALQPMFPDLDPKLKVFITTCISGAAAELGSCAMWVPFDVATQRLQIQGALEPRKHKNGYRLLRHIYESEGIKGLYRGFGATIIRNIPSSAAWWSTYEVTKSYLRQCNVRKLLHLPPRQVNMLVAKHSGGSVSIGEQASHANSEEARQLDNEDPVIHCIAGVVAAATATTLTNPLDVAKTRLQTTSSHQILPHHTHPPFPLHSNNTNTTSAFSSIQNVPIKNTHNIFSVLALTLRQEGIKALGKGLVPALLISTPYSVIAIVIYEQVKKWAVIS